MAEKKRTNNWLLIRYKPEKQARLKKAAALSGKTVSEIVRQAVEEKIVKLSRRYPELEA